MTQKTENQKNTEELNGQSTDGVAGEVHGQVEEIKPKYAPKYTVKKIKETKGFEFKEVGYREVVFGDMTNAQRISGESDGNQFTLAIIALTCEFDGKPATFEDLQTLKWADFLELSGLVQSTDWMGTDEQLSFSLGRLGLNSPQLKK